MNGLASLTVRGPSWVAYYRGKSWDLRYEDRGGRRKHRVPREVQSERDLQRYVKAFLGHLAETTRGNPEPPIRRGNQINPRITFQQFGELWSRGILHEMFPVRVEKKSSAKDDASRLKKHVYPHIGHIQVRAFQGTQALDWAEEVLSKMDAKSRGSARQVGQVINRLLTMAAFPGIQLIPQNPLPKGYVPPAKNDKAKTYLYPSEEAQMMANRGIPLTLRVFFGLCAREGARIGNFLDLRFQDIDFEHGIIHLGKTKTTSSSSWVLDPGTVVGLARYRDRFVKPDGPQAFIFLDEDGQLAVDGQVIHRTKLAETLRSCLKRSEVTRRELFEKGAHRLPIRAHDLRASFITVKLANGKTETWVMDRTDHKSSQMINAYRRRARAHAEANLGDFIPLHEAIPELASDD